MRRVAAAFALWLCAAIPAFAQNRENLPIVGILRINTPDTVEPFATGFKDALAALGLVDGRNIRIEVRLAEGHIERLPELAQSLVQAKANVILAFSDPAIRAAQQATGTIPIIGNTGDHFAGPLAGQTLVIDKYVLQGHASRDGETVTLATPEPVVETITLSSGTSLPRICHRAVVLLKR